MKMPRSVSAVLAAGALSLAAATVPAPAHATPGWSSVGSGEVREGRSLSGSFERGSIISVEELSDDLVLTGASRGWLFEYATEGPHGQQATSLGTLYVPPGLAPSGGWPVVSYGHGTQGLGDKNISYPHWVGEDNTGDQCLSAWLNAGFAVAATEYVGLGTEGVHPYLNSHSEGAAMIDAVRAARSVSGDLSTTFVTNGYSQGGQASIAAGAMAADYAPELTLAAITAGGVPAGVADELSAVSPALQIAQPDLATYLAFTLAGFRAVDPSFTLDNYLTEAGRSAVEAAQELNYFEMSAMLNDVPIGTLVTQPLGVGPLIGELRKSVTVPATGWGAPAFIYQQSLDVVSPAAFTTALVADARLNGADVTYRLDHELAGHAGWDTALDEAIDFSLSKVSAS